MTQEESSLSLLRDMRTKRNMSVDLQDFIFSYLQLSFAVGFDLGTKQSNNSKRVYQYTSDDIYITSFPSASAADRSLGYKIKSVSNSIKHKHKCHGFIFKYTKTE